MYYYSFVELFVEEAGGELESKFVLKVVQCGYHRDYLQTSALCGSKKYSGYI